MFRRMRQAAAGAATLALAACGGGGGQPIASVSNVPPPAPTTLPPSTSTPPVTIFAAPAAGDYVSVGVSTNDDLDKSTSARFQTLSFADADQPHIRYTAAGYYEIRLPGRDWDRLVHYKGLGNPDASNNYFQPATAAQNFGYLVTSNSRNSGYRYSELGSWGNLNLSLEGGFGAVAFGVATPAGGVPLTGSATYGGVAYGTTDVLAYDNLFGGTYSRGAGGTVSLGFDFAAGTLSGSMDLSINGDMNPIPVGTYRFKDTIFSAGSTTYSGKFDTSLAGANSFMGRLTGPNAEETIGGWAVPFVNPGNGELHTAIGAWVAKRP